MHQHHHLPDCSHFNVAPPLAISVKLILSEFPKTNMAHLFPDVRSSSSVCERVPSSHLKKKKKQQTETFTFNLIVRRFAIEVKGGGVTRGALHVWVRCLEEATALSSSCSSPGGFSWTRSTQTCSLLPSECVRRERTRFCCVPVSSCFFPSPSFPLFMLTGVF